MAPPVPDAARHRLSLRRIWQLVCARTPGRGGYALRIAAGCTMVVLVGEIWQVPELSVPTLVTLILWQKDRVTNGLAGVALNIAIMVPLALVYGLIRLTLGHVLGLTIAVAILSFIFFFLGSASKLKPVSYMLGLVVVYALIVIDKVPVGEIITRALLYADLFLAIPGVVMTVLGLLICPGPKDLLTQAIAARLRAAASLLRNPDARTREAALDLARAGTGEMEKWIKLAGIEHITPKPALAVLRQAARSSVAALALADAATREREATEPGQARALIRTMEEMAEIFDDGDYPTAIADTKLDTHGTAPAPALAALGNLLTGFTTPQPEEDDETDEEKRSGFFFPDAFSNPEHIRFAVKGTASVMLAWFVFEVLDWYGIHTMIITCFIVALPTIGEMISKFSLRIAGALVGGALGILSIIVVMPHLVGITGFLVLIFAVSLFAAWVKAGDERISYAGFQIGLAFYLSDLKGYGPTTDMETARDRIIGILLGMFITYAVFSTFWPSSAYDTIGEKLRAVARALRRQHERGGAAEAFSGGASSGAFLARAASTQAAIAECERAVELAAAEPSHMRARMTQLDHYRHSLDEARRLSEDMLVAPTPVHEDRLTRLKAQPA